MWQPIETYQLPTEEWDFGFERALFFSKETGIVIGCCILQDQEEREYVFLYDRDGLRVTPTHWMPLPQMP